MLPDKASSQAKATKKWWPDPGSNWGHKDFQSFALPTELSSHQGAILKLEMR